MIIRSARSDEAALIKELVYELAVFEKAPEKAQATLADFAEAFFSPHPAVFCDFVEDGGGMVQGFAIWFLNYSTWTGTHGIYLEDLYIRPTSRGKGYGKALLSHLAALCVERGYHRLQWWVLDWNAGAIAFYEGLGATLMEDWTVMRMEGQALNRLSGNIQ